MSDDLEQQAMRFDKAVYDVACELAKSAPLDLNAWHFEQLAIISPVAEMRAREAQRLAQLAIVQSVTQKSTPPLRTKSTPAVKAPDTYEEFIQRYGKKHVTYKALHEATDVLIEALKALKTENKALAARLLELEAQVAVQHAHR